MAELIIDSGDSAWIDQGDPDFVQDASEALAVYGGMGPYRRTLLQLPLSTFPAGATPTAATLRIHRGSGFGTSTGHVVHRVTAQWDPEQVTWNERLVGVAWDVAGGDYAGSPSAGLPGGHDQYVEANVLALFEAALAAEETHLRLLIRSTDEGGLGITEKTYAPFGSANPPDLTVEYTPAEVPESAAQKTLALGMGVGL